MQVFVAIVAGVVALLLILVDVYLMAFYSHRDETNLSAVNLFCKFLIVLTLFQSQCQPFFLIFDVVNSRTSAEDLTLLWLVLYLSLLANLAILKPIATSLYQRDHEDPCWKSALWSIVEIFVSVGVFGVFLGISWSFWGQVSIPVDLVTVDARSAIDSSVEPMVLSTSTLKFGSNVITFVVAFFCILGYPLLACCGACGLTVLPISLVLDFVNRPQFRRTADAKKVAEFLKVETVRLLKDSERLKREAARLESVQGFFEKRNVSKQFQNQLKSVETELQTQRDYYELFKMELEMQATSVYVFWGKLLLGVLAAIGSIFLWVQMYITTYSDYSPS